MSEYLRAASMAGLDAKAALILPPGVVFDMFELAYGRKGGEVSG